MLDTFRHEALPVDDRGAFISSCVALTRDGLDRDERVIVLADQGRLDDVGDALGRDAEGVSFVATDEHGRNPTRLTTILHSFQAAGDGRPALGVTQAATSARSPAAWDEVRLTEFVLNQPEVQAWPLVLVCLYDQTEADTAAWTAMREAHPVVRGDAINPAYRPGAADMLHASDLEPAPIEAVRWRLDPGGLADTRRRVRRLVAGAQLAPDRADDLVLAVNEIASNSLRHGRGAARLALWFEPGAIVCEVRDAGQIADPLVGRLIPPPGATSGRGLWLANNLCDLLQLRSSTAGTVVRMHVDRGL